MDSILIWCQSPATGDEPFPLADYDLENQLIEPYSALTAHLIGIFHQQSNEEKRKADDQHYSENDPAPGTDLLERVGAIG